MLILWSHDLLTDMILSKKTVLSITGSNKHLKNESDKTVKLQNQPFLFRTKLKIAE